LRHPRRKVIAHQLAEWKSTFLSHLFRFELVKLKTQHESVSYLELLGPLGIEPELWNRQPSLSETVQQRGIQAAESLNLPKSYLVAQLGAANQVETPKRWPLAHWKVLLSALEKKLPVVLVGDASEVEFVSQIATASGGRILNLCGKTSILQLIGVLSQADCVIGGDSGVCHLASALGRKTRVLWGPTSFERTHQIGPQTEFLSIGAECSPCTGNIGQPSEREAYRNCAYQHRCMKNLKPEWVLENLKL
jgi:ADP-heptose:LPS heptosyltransferase